MSTNLILAHLRASLLATLLAIGACAPTLAWPSAPVLPAAPGETLRLTFEYRLSSVYKVTWVKIWIDGAEVNASPDASRPSIIRPDIPRGAHRLLVASRLDARGYRFLLCSHREFDTSADSTLNLKVIVFEQGGALKPFEERLALKYVVETIRGENIQVERPEKSALSAAESEKCRAEMARATQR